MKAFLFIFLFSLAMLAENKELDLNERLFDLEAKVSSMEENLEATKTLAVQEKANAFNPSISVVVDLLGQYRIGEEEEQASSSTHTHEWQNGVLLRETEIEFGGSVDPYADAMVSLAVEQEKINKFSLHMEEAFIRLKQMPILNDSLFGIEIKIGRFLGAFGRANRMHLHNIGQIDHSLASKVFLGEHGFFAQGLSLNKVFFIGDNSALNLSLEGSFKHKLAIEKKSDYPLVLAHVWWHQQINENNFLDLGTSSLLTKKESLNKPLVLFGADLHYSLYDLSNREEPLFLFGAEFFMANGKEKSKMSLIFGHFSWAQVRLFKSTFVGLRYDIAPKEQEKNLLEQAASVYLSYYTSEFLRFRLGYEYLMPKISSFIGEHRFMFLTTFVLGAHPSEPYYVNR